MTKRKTFDSTARCKMRVSWTGRLFPLVGYAALAVCLAFPAGAATITSLSKISDATGESSFDSGKIFGGSKPTSGNDYVVVDGLIRTPDFTASFATNVVFGGDLLQIGNASREGQMGMKTVYTDDSKVATVTVGDLRLHRSVLNLASSGKCRLAGNITVYKADRASKFQCSSAGARTFEVASTVTGAEDARILFENAISGDEFRMIGDMSGYLGAVESTCAGGRLVLACPYAASATTLGASAKLTLGPDFSYVGTGSMPLPAGTRFTAGYDAATGTTVPVELDSEHFTLASSGEFEVALDGKSLSAAVSDYTAYAGKTFPVVKIPSALRVVTEADFTDASTGLPTGCMLPYRKIEVAMNGSGMQTVSIVTFPVVTLSSSVTSANLARSNGQWWITDAGTWANGKVPEQGNDYCVDKAVKNTLRTSGGSTDAYTFTGRTLTLTGALAHKNGRLEVENFYIWRNSTINAAGTTGNAISPWQAIAGTMKLLLSSWDQPVIMAGSSAQFIDLQSELSGGGTLVFKPYDGRTAVENDSTTVVATRARITGDNSAFTGQIRLYSSPYVNGATNEAQTLEFDAPENLGGAPASFDYRALAVGPGCTLAPRKPMTLGTANRGMWVDTLGRIAVTNGTFGVRWPIRMNGIIRKEGDGVLALGGPVSFGAGGTASPDGANNVLEVSAGGIQPLTTNGFARLAISFGEGARLVADAAATDAGVTSYGLLNTYGPFTLPADGKLRVRIVGGPDGPENYSVALCTVTPASAAALAGNIAVDTLPKRTVSIRSETVDVGGTGLVRFVADVRTTGCTVIIR